MKSRLVSVTLVVLAAGLLGGGCASMNNIEYQRRVHATKSRPAVLQATRLNDGSPAIGIELTSLSAWDAITTNKPAATWAAVKDAAVAALVAWGIDESGVLDSGDNDKRASTPPIIKDSTVINNLGSGGVAYQSTDYRWEPTSSATPTAPGVYNSTVINNAGNGWVNYQSTYGSKPDEQ
jgi:hypothetical protein